MKREDMEKLVKEMKELCEKATPGEWIIRCQNDPVFGENKKQLVCSPDTGGLTAAYGSAIIVAEVRNDPETANFIAHSRTAVPALITALEEAWEERDRLIADIKRYESKADEILVALKEKP